MMETTNIGAATTGAETEEHGLRKYLGRYLRYFLMSLVALAFFGVLSVAAPKEALASPYDGWYPTLKSDGQYYSCYWIYWGTDEYGYDVWEQDGCIYYYGGSLPAYYAKYSTGQTLVDINGTWYDQAYLWYNYGDLNSFVIPGYTHTLADYNNPAIDLFMAEARNDAAAVWTRSSYAASFSRDSEVSGQAPTGPKSSTVSGVPEAGSEAPRLDSEATQSPEKDSLAVSSFSSQTEFPWKVCQDDNRSCMGYSGNAWKQVRTSKAKGGTYRVSSSKIRGAFFAATGATNAGGSTMKLITKTGPTMGKAKVLVVNLSNAKVVKQVTFDLKTANTHYKVAKSITGLTSHKPYGLMVLSANGRPVAVDAVGYEEHGSMCHNVL
jgi:hypothetical protein